jgi:hypothetical protein
MKKLALGCVLILVMNTPSIAYAKEEKCMLPPKPLDNKMLGSMVGTWKGVNDMMGTQMADTLKVSWTLNHQFLKMELTSQAVNDPNYHYEGLGIFGIDQNGKVKTWWFDSWGASGIATGSGSLNKNEMKIKDGNAYFQEERSFVVSGNTMTMHAKGTMSLQEKSKSFDQTGIYKKY